ncbi:hypothetical protein F2Q68_00015077 [Brassica cretica]|uniref:Uncharacterized protein n=1 Tax=Brassica cretica TaxID=69181 RepID=A0A8S9HMA4_BRACR|nr:hypothetical protein F2Q68_00015077 [Brassica cretica]
MIAHRTEYERNRSVRRLIQTSWEESRRTSSQQRGTSRHKLITLAPAYRLVLSLKKMATQLTSLISSNDIYFSILSSLHNLINSCLYITPDMVLAKSVAPELPIEA